MERGTHEQLMAKGRRYRAMVEMQMGPSAATAVGLDAPLTMDDATSTSDLAAGGA